MKFHTLVLELERSLFFFPYKQTDFFKNSQIVFRALLNKLIQERKKNHDSNTYFLCMYKKFKIIKRKTWSKCRNGEKILIH